MNTLIWKLSNTSTPSSLSRWKTTLYTTAVVALLQWCAITEPITKDEQCWREATHPHIFKWPCNPDADEEVVDVVPATNAQENLILLKDETGTQYLERHNNREYSQSSTTEAQAEWRVIYVPAKRSQAIIQQEHQLAEIAIRNHITEEEIQRFKKWCNDTIIWNADIGKLIDEGACSVANAENPDDPFAGTALNICMNNANTKYETIVNWASVTCDRLNTINVQKARTWKIWFFDKRFRDKNTPREIK